MEMKTRRRLISPVALLFLLLATGCAETEHTEAITAEITAAQIEGRTAARDIISREWTDTAELQKALLDAKVKQSKYLIEGNPEGAAAFDSAFISTIRVVNPSLAKKIKP